MGTGCASARLFRANHLGDDTIFCMKDTETKTLPKNGPQPTARRGAPRSFASCFASYQGHPDFFFAQGSHGDRRTRRKDCVPKRQWNVETACEHQVTDSSGKRILRDHRQKWNHCWRNPAQQNGTSPIEDGDVIRLGNTIAMMRYILSP